MIKQITDGICVSVKAEYKSEMSDILSQDYFFSYQITIENFSNYTFILKRRNWEIFESNGTIRNVSGEGVVGLQPMLEPGESFQYISACNIKNEIGKMSGYYEIENLKTKKIIQLKIPAFKLEVPFKLN